MSSSVPEGWLKGQLSSIATLEYGKSPNHVRQEEGQYPIVGTSGIVGTANQYLWDEKSVVIGRKGTINKPIYIETPFWAIDTTYFCKFAEDTDPKWFYYKVCEEQLEKHNEASGVPSLSRDTLRGLQFEIPPLPEQKKIASILTSVDEVIENTQKQIDKLQDLKKATMNELLTKGIGHTEFKDSELGRIPKSWEVFQLGKSVKNPICYGIVQVGDYDPNGVKVIAIKYLGKINESNLHLSNKTIEEKYKRSRVNGGDLLISIKGTIGRVDIVPDGFVGNISRDVARISLSSNYIPDVIQAYLESSVGKTNIAQTTVGTTRAELSIGRLIELKIPKIPLEEQLIIKQIYRSFNIEIATKFKKLTQIQSLKKSLMQDLLTGKVRVTVN